jgi:arylsulfatase A-like enzyme
MKNVLRWIILLFGLDRFAPAEAQARPPNILLIISDDQGYGEFGFTGNDLVQTPNLDRLAAKGAFYTDFIVTPSCSPTRVSLLTGRNHLLAGVWGVGPRGDARRDEVFLPAFLKPAGYQSWLIGKPDTGFMMELDPLARGFDWYNIIGGGYLQQRPWMITPSCNEWIEGWTADIMTDSAIEKIRAAGDSPWLAYVAYIIPHYPWETSDHYAVPYRNQGLPETISQIFGSITQMDHNIGRLLDTLRETGQQDNTIILFFCDNGPSEQTSAWKNNNYRNAQHSEDWKYRNPHNLAGAKGEIWDHGMRSPLLVSWPGRIVPGKRTQLAAVEDILPTLIDLTAIPSEQMPDHLPFCGQSLRRSLENPAAPSDREEVFRLALAGPGEPGPLAPRGIIGDATRVDYSGLHTILRGERYKFHHLPGGRYSLFDMTVDEGERQDVSAQYPELTASMAQRCRDRWDGIASQNRTFQMRQLKIDNADRQWIKSWTLHANRALHFEGEMRSVFSGGARGFRFPGDRADYEIEVQKPLTVSFVAEGKGLDQCAAISLLVEGQTVSVISRSADKIVFASTALPAGDVPLSLAVAKDAKAGTADGEVMELTLKAEK